ncbi:MAG: tyrosine-type recombinase/integrase [Gammaproteobacteria bacterium]|nr:tyrosine-type recombinase/integrase [Gammaproteobacteria bacterium]
MIEHITNKLLTILQPKKTPYDVRDSQIKGFLVRVNKSGKLVYMCQYGRGKRIMLGRVGIISLAAAREEARKVLADAVKGIDPKTVRQEARGITPDASMTFLQFIQDKYAPWVKLHNISGHETTTMLTNRFFPDFGPMPLNKITLLMIEEWRTKRLKTTGANTINRNITALRAALNQAVKWELLDKNPIEKFTALKTDHMPIIRYLSAGEEKRLRAALEKRDQHLKETRNRTNHYRKTTTLPMLPDLSQATYADYLHPMIVLSINTGIRRGELFRLDWSDIDFGKALLSAKSRKSKKYHHKIRHIPLNSEALNLLKKWRDQQTHTNGPIFINEKTGKRLTTIKNSWHSLRDDANLENFRWHDFRHHFASSLVMAGIDLNTVRELLGHADIKMTLRYAHLAPHHKANAVEKLLHSTKDER